MANAINSVKYNDNTYTFTLPYGVCSTAAGTVAKTVDVDNFSLETGARVSVKFTYANTATSPTLNVESTGAKAIYWHGAALSSSQYWEAGAVLDFVYNGTQWEIVSVAKDNNTTYTSLKNPNALTIQGNGTTLTNGTYDGSAAKTVNITPSSIGAAAASHNHSASQITSGTISTARLPAASGTQAGITLVYPAASCTTFSSDSGTVTPLAVQKGAKMFAISRPDSVTDKAITRYSGTDGDVQDSKIIIEDVTNTRDTSKKAQVIAIPAEGNKKMVYGYCTDQVDGTSFIGGVFDADATSYPYSSGLAIGGTSGNLLWKGTRVATTSDIPSSLKNPASLTIQGNGTTLTNGTYDGSAAKTVNITPSAIGAAASSHGTHVSYGTSASEVGTSTAAGSATTVSRSDHTHALGQSALTAIFNAIYPVGSIYMSANSTNPGTLFGGTWVAWGAGRVPVGMGSNGTTNYSTVESTGGAESRSHSHGAKTSGASSGSTGAASGNTGSTTLTQAQMPLHTHGLSRFIGPSNAEASNYGLTLSNPGFTDRSIIRLADSYINSGGTNYVYVEGAGSSQGHTHTLNSHTHSLNSHTHSVPASDSQSTDVRQPYITCYMWKRTA